MEAARTEAMADIDRRVGINRTWFGVIWWALAAWVTSAHFNIFARTQQFQFSLPWAPDFKDTASPFGVAAIGVIAGAPLYWLVALGLWYYARTWGPVAGGWPERVPSVSKDLTMDPNRPFPRLIQAFVLFVAIILPLIAQCHFVDKFLAGSSMRTGTIFARSWREHLFQLLPAGDACSHFTYDGMASFSYCEFYEPWGTVVFTIGSFFLAGKSLWCVLMARRRLRLPRRQA